MSDTVTRIVAQYAIQLPDGQLSRSDHPDDLVQDHATVWHRRDGAESGLALLREKAASTGTTTEFDAGAAVVKRTVLVIALPFEQVP